MIRVNKLNISYQRKILENVDFEAKSGEVTLICGDSGTGKTTLLYRLALLSSQNDYNYSLNNKKITLSNQNVTAKIRRYHIAYIMQDFMLIDYYTVKENMLHYAKIVQREITNEEIENIFNQVHLHVPLDQSIETLSGGERQRLAIACALVKNSEVIILDEPTSNLDSKNEETIFKLLQQLSKETNKCIILASHSQIAKHYAQCIYEIRNYQLICTKHSEKCDQNQFTEYESKSDFQLLNSYVKQYFQKFKKEKRKMILIFTLSLFMVFIVIAGVRYYQIESQNDILKTSDNQIYITSQNNKQLVTKTNQITDKHFIDSLKVNKIYPYIYSQMTLFDTDIDILPYFEENNINDKLEYQYNLLDKKAIILNYDVYQLLKRNYLSTNYLDGYINMRIDNEDKTYYVNKKINQNIKGVLNDGEINHYTKNKYCIYFPYELLMELYQQETSNNQFIGYTLFSNNFNDHLKLIENIKQFNQLSINDSFQNTDILNQINNNAEQMKYILILIVIIGTVFIMSMMSFHHFQSRKKEFVLSMINGLGHKQIMEIIMLENIYLIIFSIFIFIVGLFVICFIMPTTINEILNICIWIVMDIILLMIAIFIINHIEMKRFSIEEVLRNE